MASPGKLLTAIVLSLALAVSAAAADEFSLSQPRTFVGPESDVSPAAESAKRAAPGEPRPLPLAPPRERPQRDLAEPRSPRTPTSALPTVVGSLVVVLGLFFIVAWFLRRTMPQSMTRLPSEAVEQLGRAPLAGKQNLHLLRVGGKLLLVVVTPFGAETLTEITDAEEVERLAALCKQNGAHGPSAEFRNVLRQFEREPAGPGFLGETHRPDVELANAGAARTRTRGEFHA